SCEEPLPLRSEVVRAYLVHVESSLAHADKRGPSPTILLRPLLNLFVGQPGTKRWKQAVNARCRSGEDLDALVAFASELEQALESHSLASA
ncbi:MAG: hypothetical protein KC457_34355, partial [Myxococcales bacterium]|nr:hypothetical protein [Myxococcales bacterium]